jgi:DNA primase
MQAMDGRARFVEQAVPLLQRLPPDVYRHMLIERIAGLARLSADYLEQVVDGREQISRSRQKSAPEPAGMDGSGVRRTPVRLAVALLLHRPALALEVDEIDSLRGLDDLPGLPLLVELLELARQEPHIVTSAVLERFQDSAYEAVLWKLATWDHLVPEAGLSEEFSDAMRQVRKSLAERRLQHLNERLQAGEITPEEWAEINGFPPESPNASVAYGDSGPAIPDP